MYTLLLLLLFLCFPLQYGWGQDMTEYSNVYMKSFRPQKYIKWYSGDSDSASQECYILKFDTLQGKNQIHFRYVTESGRSKYMKDLMKLCIERTAVCSSPNELIKEDDECGVPYLARRYVVQENNCRIEIHLSIYFDRMKIYGIGECETAYDPRTPISSAFTLRRLP